MSARFVKWHRSAEGFVESKCGRFRIAPKFQGCTTPKSYELIDGRATRGSLFESQRDCKLEAEEIAKREECERIVRFAEDLARERRERK